MECLRREGKRCDDESNHDDCCCWVIEKAGERKEENGQLADYVQEHTHTHTHTAPPSLSELTFPCMELITPELSCI